MPRTPRHLVLALVAVAIPLLARAESPDLEISAYGDLVYSHYDFGPDQKSGENGAPADDRAAIDLARFVFEVGYEFSPTLEFETEIEIEHGGTGAATELEYDEFGEYEIEVEKGGEVVLEELHLTKEFAPALSLRAGHFVVPVGATNECHTPDCYFGTSRPESEASLLPVTWHESGVELFGRWRGFDYRAQLVNGLDSTGFSSRFWVRDGHQGKFETTRATDMAAVLRLDYRAVKGLRIGGALYRGDTTGNRPKLDMEGIQARLTIVTGDLSYEAGSFVLRGMALFGSLENAAEISAKNGRLSTNLGVARTPVAKEARAWSVEAGLDVMPWITAVARTALYPFVRYETYDSMHAVDAGIFADLRFDRSLVTFGLDWFIDPSVVLKTDYSIRSFGADRYRDEKTLSVGFGLTIH